MERHKTQIKKNITEEKNTTDEGKVNQLEGFFFYVNELWPLTRKFSPLLITNTMGPALRLLKDW